MRYPYFRKNPDLEAEAPKTVNAALVSNGIELQGENLNYAVLPARYFPETSFEFRV